MFYRNEKGSTFESRRLADEKAVAFDLRVSELIEGMKDPVADPLEHVFAAVEQAHSEFFGSSCRAELVFEYD